MTNELSSLLLDVVQTRITKDFARQIRESVELLTEEEIWWRPHEQANSVGNLILHLCGSAHYYFSHVIKGEPLHRDRPAEFSARGTMPKADLLQMFNTTIEEARKIIVEFPPERLMEKTDRTGKLSSYARIFLHVSHHTAAHTGQIVYIAKTLHEGEVQELWMKHDRAAPF